MQKLQQKLSQQLTAQQGVTLKHSKSWCVPVHTYAVSYAPIKRIKMDALMKMVLIAIHKAKFADGNEISTLLFVEPLFINDLLQLLQREQLVIFVDNFYALTAKGQQQLANGELEETLDEVQSELYYSPLHQQFLALDIVALEQYDELPPVLPYANDTNIEEPSTEQFISALQIEVQEGQEVTAVNEVREQQINDVPCLEFLLYNAREDNFYVRIYNVLLQEWDAELEQFLSAKEMPQWREQYSKK